jgi:hypothetical protein
MPLTEGAGPLGIQKATCQLLRSDRALHPIAQNNSQSFPPHYYMAHAIIVMDHIPSRLTHTGVLIWELSTVLTKGAGDKDRREIWAQARC